MKPDYRALFTLAIAANLGVLLGVLLTPRMDTPAVIEQEMGIPIEAAGIVHALAIGLLLVGLLRPPPRDLYFLVGGVFPVAWYAVMTALNLLLFDGGIAETMLTACLALAMILIYLLVNGRPSEK